VHVQHNGNLPWFKKGTDEINDLNFGRYIGALKDSAVKCWLSKLKKLAVQLSTEGQIEVRA